MIEALVIHVAFRPRLEDPWCDVFGLTDTAAAHRFLESKSRIKWWCWSELGWFSNPCALMDSLSLSLSLSHQWIKVGIKEREEYEISIKSHLALRWLKITYLSYTCHDCLLFKKHTVLFSFLKVFLNFFYFKLLFLFFIF
jgi:hypothetical protein